MKSVLTIAGSDSSGGAGIQADIKTMTANGVYAMSAITALTAQNTTGVSDILEVPPAFLAHQLDAIFTDIFPDAVKIGMVSSAPLIEVIAEKLPVGAESGVAATVGGSIYLFGGANTAYLPAIHRFATSLPLTRNQLLIEIS